ncbi:hypothetical protein [Pseudomonas amygdali]|jgi:hypothetical protein|uniref:hypothetical protein n=1 Tax=Pseudomonas amygdali TaxID=47877 RepID=UPI001179E1CD|nr:hypothetical protein [Pseudomonas amygdali]
MLLAYFKYLILPLSLPLALGVFLTSEIVSHYEQPNSYKHTSLKTKRLSKNTKTEREVKNSLPPI